MSETEKSSPLSLKAWELFDACFSDGDDVIVIDEDDGFHWGSLEVHKTFCLLSRAGLKEPDRVDWIDVSFISHDGFPVQKLTGADGRIRVETVDTVNTQRAIRELLTLHVCAKCRKKLQEDEVEEGEYKRVWRELCNVCNAALHKARRFVRGDPWEVGPCKARLFNPGNSGQEHWMGDYEEVVVARSSDDAAALMWGLHTVFHVETA